MYSVLCRLPPPLRRVLPNVAHAGGCGLLPPRRALAPLPVHRWFCSRTSSSTSRLALLSSACSSLLRTCAASGVASSGSSCHVLSLFLNLFMSRVQPLPQPVFCHRGPSLAHPCRALALLMMLPVRVPRVACSASSSTSRLASLSSAQPIIAKFSPGICICPFACSEPARKVTDDVGYACVACVRCRRSGITRAVGILWILLYRQK